MFKRKIKYLLVALLSLFIMNGKCQCEKDINHAHIDQTNICEDCHKECECQSIQPCFDPGDDW